MHLDWSDNVFPNQKKFWLDIYVNSWLDWLLISIDVTLLPPGSGKQMHEQKESCGDHPGPAIEKPFLAAHQYQGFFVIC
jgi:hypothetical protein